MKEIIRCHGNFKEIKKGLDINYSDIFSYLINRTAQCVVHYKSDLYYDLKSIEEMISEVVKDSEKVFRFVGLRESGVDGNTHFKYRLNNNDIAKSYIEAYIVKIEKEHPDVVLYELDLEDLLMFKEIAEKGD